VSNLLWDEPICIYRDHWCFVCTFLLPPSQVHQVDLADSFTRKVRRVGSLSEKHREHRESDHTKLNVRTLQLEKANIIIYHYPWQAFWILEYTNVTMFKIYRLNCLSQCSFQGMYILQNETIMLRTYLGEGNSEDRMWPTADIIHQGGGCGPTSNSKHTLHNHGHLV